ncbi:hypothetical protein FB45DRAFT_911301, partial [Roridomyces roridus]
TTFSGRPYLGPIDTIKTGSNAAEASSPPPMGLWAHGHGLQVQGAHPCPWKAERLKSAEEMNQPRTHHWCLVGVRSISFFGNRAYAGGTQRIPPIPLYPNGTGTASLMAASSRHLCLPSPCRKVCGAKHQPPFLSHYLPRAYLDPAKCRPRHQPRQCPSMSPRRPTSPRVVRPQREADGRCGLVALVPRRSYHAIRSEAHIRRQRAASLPNDCQPPCSLFPFPFACSPALPSSPRGPTTVLRIVLATPVTLSPRRSTPLSKRTDDLQVHHGLVLYCCTTVVSMEAWRWA